MCAFQKRIYSVLNACSASLLAVLFYAFVPASAQALGTITIIADSSISVAMAEIARNYARDKQVVVNASFASQRAQEAQINEGAASDILITTNLAWIETLKGSGLVDVYSQMQVARGRMALVGPAGSTLQYPPGTPFPSTAIIGEIGGEPGFVVGYPQTRPEGVFGKQVMRNADPYGEMEPYTLYVKQRDQMFELVSTHGAYGLFFYSGVMARQDIRVVSVLPESLHNPIGYYAVVIAGDNMNAARKFLEYLKTPDAKRVLVQKGFSAGS